MDLMDDKDLMANIIDLMDSVDLADEVDLVGETESFPDRLCA